MTLPLARRLRARPHGKRKIVREVLRAWPYPRASPWFRWASLVGCATTRERYYRLGLGAHL
jgi:hypothetical protein